MTSPLPVRTRRLLLRAVRPDDVDDLLAYYSDPAIMRYVPFDAVPDAEALAERMERYLAATDPHVVGDVLNTMVELDGHVVGDLMLRMVAAPGEHQPPAVAEVGWVFNPAYGGRGIATEAARAVVDLAFTHYGLHRVTAQLDPRNTASARICERLGMTHEATTRRDYWAKGQWSDTAVYGLLREEWPPPVGGDAFSTRSPLTG